MPHRRTRVTADQRLHLANLLFHGTKTKSRKRDRKETHFRTRASRQNCANHSALHFFGLGVVSDFGTLLLARCHVSRNGRDWPSIFHVNAHTAREIAEYILRSCAGQDCYAFCCLCCGCTCNTNNLLLHVCHTPARLRIRNVTLVLHERMGNHDSAKRYSVGTRTT